MTEDKQSTTNLILIGIVSSIIGGLFVYYLLKKTNKLDPDVQYANSSKLNTIENKIQPSQVIQNPNNTIYKNNESWEILRDRNGFISKLNVLRDVKLNK
jgi:hypothetical protein